MQGDHHKAEAELEAGADIEHRLNGETPLHHAVANSHPAIVDLLLAHGADANAKTPKGETTLHLVVTSTYMKPGDTKHSVETLQANAVTMARSLIAAGAAVDVSSENTDAPLMDAARIGLAPLVTLLLKNGADPNLKDRNGFTALHRAMWKGAVEAVLALVDAGCYVGTAGVNGATPLHVMAKMGHKPVLDTLLRQESGYLDLTTALRLADGEGATPADLATKQGHRELALLILRHSGGS